MPNRVIIVGSDIDVPITIAPVGFTVKRVTVAGLVIAGAHEVFWIACSPDAPGAEWQLSDKTAGAPNVVYDHFDSDKDSEHLSFRPAMPFAEGIFVEKFDHMTSLVFGYV